MRWTIIVIVALALLVVLLGGQVASVVLSEKVPKRLMAAAGSEGGSYFRVMQGIKQASAARHPKVQFSVVLTQGSGENLQGVKQGRFDYAFYQNSGSSTQGVSLVANVYSESLFLLVNKTSGINHLLDLKDKIVSVGPEQSGTRQMVSEVLKRDQMALEDFDARSLGFEELAMGFGGMGLDAAFVVAGAFSPFFDELFRTGDFDVLGLPHVDATAAHNPSVFRMTIPRGYFRGGRRPIPSQDIQTVGVHASLITRSDTPAHKVRYLCEILFDHWFKLQMNLHELNEEMAQQPGDFPLHPAAADFYRRGKPTVSSYLKETLGDLSWQILLGVLAIIGLLVTRAQRAREARRLSRERVSRFIEEAFRYQALAIEESDPQRIINYHKLLVMQVKDKASRALIGKQGQLGAHFANLLAACDSVERSLLARLEILRAGRQGGE